MLKKMGIEIEASFRTDSKSRLRGKQEFWTVASDGSIHAENGYLLELQSRPFDPKTEWRLFSREVRRVYRLVEEVNASMGFHVHFSSTDPQTFASLSFERVLVRNLKRRKFAKNNELLKRRIRGEAVWGSYCYTKPNSLDTMLGNCCGDNSDRYVHVNLAAIRKHGTIEIRLFPAFETAAEVLAAVRFVRSFVAYFSKLRSQRRIEASLSLDDRGRSVNV